MTTEEGKASGLGGRSARAMPATDLSSLAVTHDEMGTALAKGDAMPLGPRLGLVARYEGSWWVECDHGWLRVTDEAAVRDLDQVAARLAEAGAGARDDACGAGPEVGDAARGEPRGDTWYST